MTRAQRTQSQFGFVWKYALPYELADHFHKRRVRPDRRGPNHFHSQFPCQTKRFRIEIVQNFQVIRNEAQGCNQDVLYALAVQIPQVVEDIRL